MPLPPSHEKVCLGHSWVISSESRDHTPTPTPSPVPGPLTTCGCRAGLPIFLVSAQKLLVSTPAGSIDSWPGQAQVPVWVPGRDQWGTQCLEGQTWANRAGDISGPYCPPPRTFLLRPALSTFRGLTLAQREIPGLICPGQHWV